MEFVGPVMLRQPIPIGTGWIEFIRLALSALPDSTRYARPMFDFISIGINHKGDWQQYVKLIAEYMGQLVAFIVGPNGQLVVRTLCDTLDKIGNASTIVARAVSDIMPLFQVWLFVTATYRAGKIARATYNGARRIGLGVRNTWRKFTGRGH
jgi:hypothetical protein